jgi:hypothetical protein
MLELFTKHKKIFVKPEVKLNAEPHSISITFAPDACLALN